MAFPCSIAQAHTKEYAAKATCRLRDDQGEKPFLLDWLLHHAYQTDNHSQDLNFLDDNWLQSVILRLKAVIALLLIKSLDRGRIIDERYHDLAVSGCLMKV